MSDERILWSARTPVREFFVTVTKGTLLLGNLALPRNYKNLFPASGESQSIECILAGTGWPSSSFIYNPKYHRIAGGLTEWLRHGEAKQNDRVLVEVLIPFKKYRLSLIKDATSESIHYLEAFERHALHPVVIGASHALFRDGHYGPAVREAYVAMVNLVKEKCAKSTNLDGLPLMEAVFAQNKPLVMINRGKSESEKEERKGFQQIASGAVTAIRNPLSHGTLRIVDPFIALEYLGLASLVCKIAEAAKKTRRRKNASLKH